MKKYGSSIVALFALIAPATAADLAPVYKAPPPPLAPVYNWTGIYVGGHVGLIASESCLSQALPVPFPPNSPDTGCGNASSWIGGGQIGFNYQVANWVFGAEFSASAVDIDSTHVPPPNSVNSNLAITTEPGNIMMLTGRIGYAWNNFLIYGKGGAAWSKANYTFVEIGQPTVFASASRSGWTYGGGAEFGFAPNWSLAFEYNRIDLGTSDLLLQPGWVIKADRTADVATARLNFRFGGSAPMMAK